MAAWLLVVEGEEEEAAERGREGGREGGGWGLRVVYGVGGLGAWWTLLAGGGGGGGGKWWGETEVGCVGEVKVGVEGGGDAGREIYVCMSVNQRVQAE
jgi:hypothetical protein